MTAALAIIDANRNDIYIHAALIGLRDIMESAGPVVIATRLRGLPPDQRARVALARLRQSGVKPERLLAIALSVSALIEDAPALAHRIQEWRVVAVAKAAHRLASGTHRQWSVARPGGIAQRIEMHTYPRSSGRVLRHLGEVIEKEAELVIDRHLKQVIALKIARDGTHTAIP